MVKRVDKSAKQKNKKEKTQDADATGYGTG
jgi:hypothetical protein